jgi:hypothetical protein
MALWNDNQKEQAQLVCDTESSDYLTLQQRENTQELKWTLIEHQRKSATRKCHQKRLAKQPQNDITLLMKELVTIGAKVPTTPKGGNHRHTGIIIEEAKCQQMAEGTASVTPVNPELYPKIAVNVST